jgi:hypothetical protein
MIFRYISLTFFLASLIILSIPFVFLFFLFSLRYCTKVRFFFLGTL